MDTNCLVTRLKSSVDNNNLRRFGKLSLQVIPGSSHHNENHSYFGIGVSCKILKSSESAITISDYGTTYSGIEPTILAGIKVFIEGDGEVYVDNFYNATSLWLGSYLVPKENIFERLNYMQNVTDVCIFSGNVKSDNYNLLDESVKPNTFITDLELGGDLCNYPTKLVAEKFPNVVTYKNAYNNKNIFYDFSYFSKLTNLELVGTYEGVQNKNIEDLIRAYRANGRLECNNFNITYQYFTLKFNGSEINNNAQISWTETTMTCNGVTINA